MVPVSARMYTPTHEGSRGGLVPRETRHSAIREKENSKLVVKGLDNLGVTFTEETVTHDISETGISFYLKTPIWVDTLLALKVRNSSVFGPVYETRAKVVRVKIEPDGRQFVAARFDE